MLMKKRSTSASPSPSVQGQASNSASASASVSELASESSISASNTTSDSIQDGSVKENDSEPSVDHGVTSPLSAEDSSNIESERALKEALYMKIREQIFQNEKENNQSNEDDEREDEDDNGSNTDATTESGSEGTSESSIDTSDYYRFNPNNTGANPPVAPPIYGNFQVEVPASPVQGLPAGLPMMPIGFPPIPPMANGPYGQYSPAVHSGLAPQLPPHHPHYQQYMQQQFAAAAAASAAGPPPPPPPPAPMIPYIMPAGQSFYQTPPMIPSALNNQYAKSSPNTRHGSIVRGANNKNNHNNHRYQGLAAAHHDDDLVPEAVEGYTVGEKKTIAEYTKLDAEDESLAKWKASLGLSDDANAYPVKAGDSRKVVIVEMALHFPDQNLDPVVINLEDANGNTIAVKKSGIRVEKLEEPLGSYAPNTKDKPYYERTFTEVEAPSGLLARGNFSAVTKFVDDDKNVHLSFPWSFNITK
ncbi:hypothetical protein QCA50_015820 [Cerrena zonata]|uniref:Uncharacterized protein n=1 Tax=Cerrena zonata TaxID=2478898 RepID=A0AAW0FSK6_9APHY